MCARILEAGRYPVPVVPQFSGGASGAVYCIDHDPAYGQKYFFPFAVATDHGISGIEKLQDSDVPSIVLPRLLRPKKMSFARWTTAAVDAAEHYIRHHGYRMEEALELFTGSDHLNKGKRVEEAVGPRKLNVHPALLFYLKHPDRPEERIDARTLGLTPREVYERYTNPRAGYIRRYTGWGEDIMPQIVQELEVSGSTVHVATPDTDMGPCIAYREKPVEARHREPEGAAIFQNELKDEGDGPAIVAAIHINIDRQGIEAEFFPMDEIGGKAVGYWELWRDGRMLPYEGIRLADGHWENELGIEPMR